ESDEPAWARILVNRNLDRADQPVTTELHLSAQSVDSTSVNLLTDSTIYTGWPSRFAALRKARSCRAVCRPPVVERVVGGVVPGRGTARWQSARIAAAVGRPDWNAHRVDGPGCRWLGDAWRRRIQLQVFRHGARRLVVGGWLVSVRAGRTRRSLP